MPPPLYPFDVHAPSDPDLHNARILIAARDEEEAAMLAAKRASIILRPLVRCAAPVPMLEDQPSAAAGCAPAAMLKVRGA